VTSDIPGLGSRREAREEALSLLYQSDVSHEPVVESLAGRGVSPTDYAIEIAEGVDQDLADIDATIARHLTGWRIERMPLLDKVIARVATWELRHRKDIPTAVVLSEAVELATAYCSEQSPRFLNGVLSGIASELRPTD